MNNSFQGGPNIWTTSSLRAIDWNVQRKSMSMMWNMNENIPLIWEAIVNELVHIINATRKTKGYDIGEYVDVYIYNLVEQQLLAIKNETAFISESCQVRKLVLLLERDKVVSNSKLNYFPDNAKAWHDELWQPIKITIKPINRRYKVRV